MLHIVLGIIKAKNEKKISLEIKHLQLNISKNTAFFNNF